MAKAARIKQRRSEQQRERFDLSDYEPPVLDEGDEEDDPEVERIEAFRVGEKSYYARTQVDFIVAVRAMEIAAQSGEAAAMAYTMREVLGDDGYQALLNLKSLHPEHFARIAVLVNKIVSSSSAEGKAR